MPLSQRDTITIVVVSAVAGFATPALGDRAWWVVPPVMFAVLLTPMVLDGRRPLTFKWVGLAAIVAVAMGAFLKVT